MISDLVFDVGMNNGDDTGHYLARGFRVVAVEADPVLCDKAREQFAEQIGAGRLVIENVGIAAESGTSTFYVNDEKSDFSSFDPAIAGRDGMKCHPITVQAVVFGDLLAKHGVPYYLKVDIERADRHCLTALNSRDLPKYVSIEAHELEYLLNLWCLGYRHFKVIDQMRHNALTPVLSNEDILARAGKRAFEYADRLYNKLSRNLRFPRASSGPFGEDTPGEWQTFEDAAYNWLHIKKGYSNRGTLNLRSWHDFHAKRD